MRRIFADANVLIAGAGSATGASRIVLTLAEVGLYRLVVSRQVLDEADRNLRKKLPQSLPVFASLLASVEPEIASEAPEPVVRAWAAIIDPKDAPILAAAIAASVDRLLTLNTKDFTAQVAHAAGLMIQTPGDFVQALREVVTEGLTP